jgi:hypothetical protein
MKWPAFAIVAITVAAASGAGAQDEGPYRRFTRPPIDPNRNNRMIYAPVVAAYPGSRPAGLPYDVSAATWYQQPLGSRAVKPDKVLDDGTYVLERFGALRDGGASVFEVVITRTPALPGAPVPELRVVHPDSAISAAGFPTVTQTAGGTTYRFLVRPPLAGFIPTGSAATAQDLSRYELRFLPAREVRNPAWMRQAGTFAGASVESRMAEGPPRLPIEERVAGKRLEFRSARSAPVVTYDEKVAGRRQEQRNRR